MNYGSLLVIIVFLLSIIPSVLFLRKQWKVRKENGIIKILRTHITHWILSLILALGYMSIRRIFILFGSDIEATWLDRLSIAVFSVVAFQTWKNYFLYKRIVKNEIKQQ